MKKIFYTIFTLIFIFILPLSVMKINAVFASPESTLNQINLAEKLLMKLQNSDEADEEIEQIYKYLDIVCHENTQFYSYNIEKLEKLMDDYRNKIIKTARDYASNQEYKKAVEFLESKSELFKDKSTINSLISFYSKFFVKDGLFYYDKLPKFISINKLIAYPNLAFCDDNPKQEELDENYMTSKEFQNLLSQLYLNDYILINFSDIVEIYDNVVYKKDLYIPLNKTPVVLIFSGINYFENEPYFIEKFIVDGKDEIACYNSKQTEKNQISYSADFISILENFIAEHNDFSFNNARGVITFDKNGGILGYNINKTNPNVNQDAITLKKLVAKLKQLGYTFGYGNFEKSYNEIENINDEFLFFKENIQPIFGNINVYFSAFDKNKNNWYYSKLNELGFKIFIDLNINNFNIKNNQVFVSSNQINGKILRNQPKILNVDYEKIYEHNSRTKLF